MAMIYSTLTGKDIGDPEILPLDPKALPSKEEIAAAAGTLILSASGWRKVFAATGGRGQDPGSGSFAPWSKSGAAEDSLDGRVGAADLCLAALMAKVFGDFVISRCAEKQAGPGNAASDSDSSGARKPAVLLGLDTRPTGPTLGDVFARVLTGMGIEVRYCFIIAAPEIMAYAGSGISPEDVNPDRADGFVYISASHNPPGHNGVKFGLSSGGVLSATEITPLIVEFRRLVSSENPAALAMRLVAAADPKVLASCFGACARWKRLANSAYTLFAHRVVTGVEGLETQLAALDSLAEACAQAPLGIVGELNGSARSTSIDRDFLESLGVRASIHNSEPGSFVHRIVPEGESLGLCASLLESSRSRDDSFELGYVPDCDGDRGNLVFFDHAQSRARALEAQEVFSLSCIAELAELRRRGEKGKVAVAVNDATSLRIDRIAGLLGAKVFRAETGEANVVNAAGELRESGWIVRILGEGSNGGTIVHPSKVRDPLSTIGAMVRLLRSPGSEDAPSLVDTWIRASGSSPVQKPARLSDIIGTLPRWISTSVFEDRAALRVRSSDKRLLKSDYARIFEAEWDRRQSEFFRKFGFTRWSAWASVGTKEFEVGGDFASSGSGGMRIVFHGEDDEPKAFLFMRGSGTEPVFRVMADLRGGSPADESFLLAWHTSMVRQADN